MRELEESTKLRIKNWNPVLVEQFQITVAYFLSSIFREISNWELSLKS